MELWIRSQDKTLLTKAVGLRIVIEQEGSTIIDEITDCILGIYNTEQRALEVLDEIQNILKPKYILDSSSIKPNGDSWVENGIIMQKHNANARVEELSTYVYEMPQE